MKVIKPKYKILTPISDDAINELKHIELIARQCYKSDDRITTDGESAKKLIKQLIKSGHEAMLEHSTLSVMFTVDRGISHELVRHRIASFAQESTRYCNYDKEKFGKNITYIDILGGVVRDSKSLKLNAEQLNAIYIEWERALQDAEKHYLKMIELGTTPQIARSVLPNSTKTVITMTANYREWRNFFKLRCADDAHPQMREITIPLLEEIKTKIPLIFDDIGC